VTTATSELTYMPTLNVSQTPTSTVSPTNTAIVLPTLDEREKEEYILSQLVDNGGCDLPCWWGITPGKSLWSDVSVYFADLGFKSSQRQDTSKFDMGGFALFSIKTYTRVAYHVESNVIQNISISVGGSLEPENFQNVYKYYSPDEILTNYGQPSRILLEIPSYGYGDRVAYGFSLFYDHLGFLIFYSGVAQRSDPVRICPSFVYDHLIGGMNLYLQSPGNSSSLEALSGGVVRGKTIEEATGKSVSEYYYEFRSNPANLCFTTSASLWP